MSRKKTSIDEKFNLRLKQLIEEKLNITQSEFAKNIGVTTGYLSMVVTEKRGPSAEMIAGIYIHYSEYLPWLLGVENKETINLRFIEKIGKWIDEICEREPFRKDWFIGQFRDAFPAFVKWEEGKEEEQGSEDKFPTSKVA